MSAAMTAAMAAAVVAVGIQSHQRRWQQTGRVMPTLRLLPNSLLLCLQMSSSSSNSSSSRFVWHLRQGVGPKQQPWQQRQQQLVLLLVLLQLLLAPALERQQLWQQQARLLLLPLLLLSLAASHPGHILLNPTQQRQQLRLQKMSAAEAVVRVIWQHLLLLMQQQ
jgi:hypothetical protein